MVTAVREEAEESTDHITTHAWPNSQDGRHTITVRRGGWAVTNVHCDSGCERKARVMREEQILHLSHSHEQGPTGVKETGVMAGNWNMREGEDSPLLEEQWHDVWMSNHGRVDKALVDDWTYPWENPCTVRSSIRSQQSMWGCDLPWNRSSARVRVQYFMRYAACGPSSITYSLIPTSG